MSKEIFVFGFSTSMLSSGLPELTFVSERSDRFIEVSVYVNCMAIFFAFPLLLAMFGWSKKPAASPPSLDELLTNNRCVMFSMPSCPWCDKAEELFRKHRLKCAVVNLLESQFLAFEVMKRSGQRTVPNIFIDGEHVGGHDSLVESLKQCKQSDERKCDFFRGSKRRSVTP